MWTPAWGAAAKPTGNYNFLIVNELKEYDKQNELMTDMSILLAASNDLILQQKNLEVNLNEYPGIFFPPQCWFTPAGIKKSKLNTE